MSKLLNLDFEVNWETFVYAYPTLSGFVSRFPEVSFLSLCYCCLLAAFDHVLSYLLLVQMLVSSMLKSCMRVYIVLELAYITFSSTLVHFATF